MALDAGGGKRLRVVTPKSKKVRKTRAPVTDVQSSGGDYGKRKAKQFKKTVTYKQSVGAAKPRRLTDASSSGLGYGKAKAHKYVAHAHHSVARALAKKPFDPEGIQAAINLGVAPDFSVVGGKVFHKNRRAVLPDTEQLLDPQRGGRKVKLTKTDMTALTAKEMSVKAPVLKGLEQTTRVSHAIAGLATEGPKGFTKGLIKNEPYSFTKVLKKAGAPSAVASVGGFVGDVALDPTTYVTAGTGSVARKAALKAGEDAAKKAAKAGMTEAGQATVRKVAESKAFTKAPAGKGVTVGFGKLEVPGVRKATAAVGRTVKKTPTPKAARKTGGYAKDVAGEFRPTLAPAGADKASYEAARRAARSSRSAANRAQVTGEAQARAIRSRIGEKDYARVIDAIERRQIGRLPDELRQPAIALRSVYRHQLRLRKRAGLTGDVSKAKGEGAAKGYVPHAQEGPLKEGLGIVETEAPVKKAGTLRKPGSAKRREDKRPISAQNPTRVAEGREPFSTDLPLVHFNYMRQSGRAVAASELEKGLAESGRRLHPGKANRIEPTEGIYHLGFQGKGSAFMLREVSRSDWEKGALPKSGQFVAIDKRTVEAARQYGKPTQAASATGRGFDKVTRGFKGLATATPGFHMRNLVGDTQLAYLQQSGHLLPRNVGQGIKATRALNKARASVETLAHGVDHGGKTIKVAGQRMPIGEFLKLAEKHGVTQSGYITRDLVDLAGESTRGAKRIRRTPRLTRIPGVKAITQDRENVLRLATFKDGLDKGLSPGRAADRSMEAHIDYADLTEVERKYARRLMPFYTFSARALPFQAKRVITRPGKFANIEKVREDFGGTDVSGFSTWTQRQVPLIIGGKAVTDSLPITLLNELPTGTKPSEYGLELGQFLASLTTPILKDPVEIYANRSFAFRNDIQDPHRPLVAAPDWVSIIPKGLRDKLGITKMPDSRSGQMVWAWPGKLDYKVKAVMLGPLNAVNQATASGANRVGQSGVEKITGPLIGVRITPPDATRQQINDLYTQLAKLDERQALLNQTGVSKKAGNVTKEYLANEAEMKKLERQIYALSVKSGDKSPPFKPGKGRRLKRIGGEGLGGGIGGGLGGGL